MDTNYGGRARKLLLQANRNGFVYVLDRATGEFLLAKPFVTNELGDGRSDGTPNSAREHADAGGSEGLSLGARRHHWYATSFSPDTRLFYVMSVEDCSIYRKSHDGGYEGYRNPGDSGLKYCARSTSIWARRSGNSSKGLRRPTIPGF